MSVTINQCKSDGTKLASPLRCFFLDMASPLSASNASAFFLMMCKLQRAKARFLFSKNKGGNRMFGMNKSVSSWHRIVSPFVEVILVASSY